MRGCEWHASLPPTGNTDFARCHPRDSVARLELAGSIHAATFHYSYKRLLLNRPPNLPKRPNGACRARRSEAWSISKTGPSSHSGSALYSASADDDGNEGVATSTVPSERRKRSLALWRV